MAESAEIRACAGRFEHVCRVQVDETWHDQASGGVSTLPGRKVTIRNNIVEKVCKAVTEDPPIQHVGEALGGRRLGIAGLPHRHAAGDAHTVGCVHAHGDRRKSDDPPSVGV